MRLKIAVAVLLLSLAANLAQHRKIENMELQMQEADSVVLRATDLMRQCQERLP